MMYISIVRRASDGNLNAVLTGPDFAIFYPICQKCVVAEVDLILTTK
jgi:hypothetical protein